LHFRDLAKASQAFAPAEQNVEAVQAFLQRVFNANADQLDLTECNVDNIEMDSTGTRARVKLRVKAKNLTTGKVLQPEILIFFKRGKADQRWYLVTQ
jgi:wobble nucleotide-excising tRNase